MEVRLPTTLKLSDENESITAYLAGIHSREYTYALKNVKEILHPNELHYFSGLKYERRKLSYLLGRYAAKIATSDYLDEKKLTEIEISSGLFNQPVVRHLSFDTPDVTISHCDDMAIAIAFCSNQIMGLDIEYITEEKLSVFQSQLTGSEKRIASNKFENIAAGAVCIWTVKEALSKALKCGFMTPFNLLEVDKISLIDDSAYLSDFKNFKQYKSISIVFNPYVLSIVLPRKTMLNNPTISLLTYFNKLSC